MGFFSRLFEKRYCTFCGEELSLLGNHKLADGLLCKNCARDLSEWFRLRTDQTVDYIRGQLEYRARNKEAVAAFHATRVLGDDTKIILDEDAGKFMVTRARDWTQANPDVIDFAQVTGCELDIKEDRDEEYYEDKEGNRKSYVPARYNYSYDFTMCIRVNHPYFQEIEFDLNSSSVDCGIGTAMRPMDPRNNPDYREYEAMGQEIKAILIGARQQARDQVRAANEPKKAMNCPACGATCIPDANGRCEYCGSAMPV